MNKAYMALGSLIGVLILSFFVYNWGYDNAETKAEADQKVAIEAALDTYKKRVTRAIKAASNFEKDKNELERYNDKLEERIQAYINKPSNPNTSCLDANGVQLFNDISSGRKSSDTSQLKRTMQKGVAEIKGWQPKFYTHQPPRYLFAVRDLS